MSTKLTVRLLDEAAFEALEKEWDRFLISSSSNTIFLTWEWIRTWWDVYGSSYQLMLLEVHTQDGERVGIAPLKIARRHYHGLPYRQVEFIGCGPEVCPEYLDLIFIERYREQVVDAVCRYLLEHRYCWDTVFLTDCQDTSTTLRECRELSKNQGFSSWMEMSSTCPYVPIDGSWDDWFLSLSSSHRYNLGRYGRQLARTHKVTFEAVRRSPEIGEMMERLFELHKKRWNERGESGSFDRHPLNKTFHQRLAERLSELDRVVIYVFKIDEIPAAILYAYQYENRISYYQSGLSMDWERYGIGQLLLKHIFEELFSHGFKEFDFLRGTEPYKYKWAPLERHTNQLRVWNRSFYGTLLRATMGIGHRLSRMTNSIHKMAKKRSLI